MRLLELFSGTGSVSKAVGEKYTEIISIDILTKFKPTISTDILTWDYTIYPRDHFHTIWASPPCTEYSKCLTTRPRNIPLANQIVLRTLEIINYFNPTLWFLENPQTGKLKDQEFMLGLPFYDVDYCQYELPYRKRTRIWTNKIGFEPRLHDKNTCTQMDQSRIRHKSGFGNRFCKGVIVGKIERAIIPKLLVQELFN
jgi:site-specific DNA-cytosine methylase